MGVMIIKVVCVYGCHDYTGGVAYTGGVCRWCFNVPHGWCVFWNMYTFVHPYIPPPPTYTTHTHTRTHTHTLNAPDSSQPHCHMQHMHATHWQTAPAYPLCSIWCVMYMMVCDVYDGV